MAIVKGVIQATGSIKGVSFYTRNGSDKVIMRAKGGASKSRITKGAEFVKLRKHQQEWGGCVQFARAVKNAVGDITRLSDFNLSPVWTGLGKNLMTLDTNAAIGERSLRLSAYRQALEGYELNRRNPFNTVLRTTPAFTVDKELLRAVVSFQRINTTMSLNNFRQLPYFRILVTLGCVSDLRHNAQNLFYNYEAASEELHGLYAIDTGAWLSTDDLIAEKTILLQLSEELLPTDKSEVTLLLNVGVEFGKVGIGGAIVPVKYAGSGRILASL
jgi:hypothetical protein